MRVTDAVGKFGEQVAADHLEAAGLEVLDRNWRCTHGELDLVASDGCELVVVEVKTRRSTAFGTPAEAVTWRKLARLRRLAAAWLSAHDEHPQSVRIDVVAVTVPRRGGPQVEHLKGVA
ncbi:MAG: YraN family protein [Micrococcales bacterium]|nr:YraN family protein [Micrococcales bacterium]MCL2666888.1 YraN family protein [Micrococcales bacterium]